MEYEVLNEPAWVSRFLEGKDLTLELEKALEVLRDAHYDPQARAFDYAGARNSPASLALIRVVRALPYMNLQQLEDWKIGLSFWLNIYNCLLIHALMRETEEPLGPLNKIPGLFDHYAFNLGGMAFSLDVIEHGVMRANSPKYLASQPYLQPSDPRSAHGFKWIDPRVHFAFYIGCQGSPKFAVYHQNNIEAELDLAAQHYLGRTVSLQRGKRRLGLPKQFKWYRDDFGDDAAIIEFVAKYLPDVEVRDYVNQHAPELTLSYSNYDWQLA